MFMFLVIRLTSSQKGNIDEQFSCFLTGMLFCRYWIEEILEEAH